MNLKQNGSVLVVDDLMYFDTSRYGFKKRGDAEGSALHMGRLDEIP
jgi:hypothetical protein